MIFINKVVSIISRHNSKKWITKLRARNQNKDFTLITNNCIGGIIYHNLGLRFLSPTINLYISGKEYLEFVKNLKYYVSCELIEATEESDKFPVGIILPKDEEHMKIHVYFQHYRTFEDAKEKWIQRCSRINYNNIFYLWEFYDNIYDASLIKEFDSLPVKKMCLLHREISDIKNAVVFDCYTEGKPVARILANDGLSGKRFLDRFDYTSFLNYRNL